MSRPWHAHYTNLFGVVNAMRMAYTTQPSKLEDAMRVSASGDPSTIYLRGPEHEQLQVATLTSWVSTDGGVGNFPIRFDKVDAVVFMEHAVLDFQGITYLSKFQLRNLEGKVGVSQCVSIEGALLCLVRQGTAYPARVLVVVSFPHPPTNCRVAYFMITLFLQHNCCL
jgi:hypothetical protein